jgi:ribonucleoside-diphosphate reductase alpha chain
MESIFKRHQLGAAALQARRRRRSSALQHPRVGAPIKQIENQSSGIIPVMKLLEDSFSYANQLGQRQGAGAVYLNAHHPDIMRFLDTKRENADEKIRIKTLSLGVVIPTSPSSSPRTTRTCTCSRPTTSRRSTACPFGDISVTEKYREMVDDPRIKKTKINAREFFQTVAEIQFESGYPYIMFEDTVNKANPIKGRINMSNLCSEILQVNTPTHVQRGPEYDDIGKDISCNLGSMNIALPMDAATSAQTSRRPSAALTAVIDQSHIQSVRSDRRRQRRSPTPSVSAR